MVGPSPPDARPLHLTVGRTARAGEATVADLCAGGRDIAVTNANVLKYIHLLANHKLNVEMAQQCVAFLRGFRDLIPVEWLRMFNAPELQRLLGGEQQRIDLSDLRRHIHYSGGYHESQPIIQWFWEALDSFTAEEQGLFLKFVTSCSRQPLLGFHHLHPRMCVHKVPLDDEHGGNDRLPSSATCMNMLKLPCYGSAAVLRERLLYSIKENAGGFWLS